MSDLPPEPSPWDILQADAAKRGVAFWFEGASSRLAWVTPAGNLCQVNFTKRAKPQDVRDMLRKAQTLVTEARS